jgi:signal transduction histidine kinase
MPGPNSGPNAAVATTDERPSRSPNRLLARLPPHIYEGLRPHLRRISLSRKRALLTARAPVNTVFFLTGGVCNIGVTTADGRDARVFRREVARPGPFQDLLQGYYAAFVDSLIQSVACNALHSIDQRYARCLLEIRDRTGRNEIPLAQNTVAGILGVRRASITVAAGTLSRAGVIELGRKHIAIRDHHRLQTAACECYPIIKNHLAASAAVSDGSVQDTAQDAVRQLIVAQETERSRIARDLHGDLGQRVAVTIAHLDMFAQLNRSRSKEVRSFVAGTRRELEQMASTVQALSHRLHPAKLELLGLRATVEGLCREVSSAHNVPVTFSCEGTLSDVSDEAQLCLFRVAEEALQCAVTHGARSIRVSASSSATQIRLAVIDDGLGSAWRAGFGLIMRHRVELVNGALTIESGRDGGTAVAAAVPITPRAVAR